MLTLVSPELEEYARSHSEPEGALLAELVEVTHSETTLPIMLTGAIEGRFLKMMVQVTQARRVLEIGMFTGYSALSMAEGLPPDGELITLELEPRYAEIARGFFERSPHGKKITVRLGEALKSLEALKPGFDLAFIDADKTNYSDYYEATLKLVRSGGVILIDNVLYGGEVVHPQSDNARAIARLNEAIARDERVDRVLLPFRDGVTFLRKR